MKRTNLEIVINYLRQNAGEKFITFPDGYRYGWYDNKICMILDRYQYDEKGNKTNEEELWNVSDMPFNYFVDQCNQMSEADIMNLVFEMGLRKENVRGNRNTDIPG